MSVDQILAVGISGVSLIVSVYSCRQSHKVAKQQNFLNEKKAYADQFNSYSSLLYNEYASLKEDLSKISTLLCDTNTAIGEILDRFDTRNKNNSSNHYSWFLRHLYCNLYRMSVEALGDGLIWHTAQYLYHQLAMFMKLDIKLDFQDNPLPKKRFLELKKKKKLNLYLLLESELFREQFTELTNSINESDYLELCNQILNQCQPLSNYLKEIEPKIARSLSNMEINYHKNKIEVFKLKERPDLNHSYRQFMKLLTFINQSRLVYLIHFKNGVPYNTVSHILYVGILIESMNQFINHNLKDLEF